MKVNEIKVEEMEKEQVSSSHTDNVNTTDDEEALVIVEHEESEEQKADETSALNLVVMDHDHEDAKMKNENEDNEVSSSQIDDEILASPVDVDPDEVEDETPGSPVDIYKDDIIEPPGQPPAPAPAPAPVSSSSPSSPVNEDELAGEPQPDEYFHVINENDQVDQAIPTSPSKEKEIFKEEISKKSVEIMDDKVDTEQTKESSSPSSPVNDDQMTSDPEPEQPGDIHDHEVVEMQTETETETEMNVNVETEKTQVEAEVVSQNENIVEKAEDLSLVDKNTEAEAEQSDNEQEHGNYDDEEMQVDPEEPAEKEVPKSKPKKEKKVIDEEDLEEGEISDSEEEEQAPPPPPPVIEEKESSKTKDKEKKRKSSRDSKDKEKSRSSRDKDKDKDKDRDRKDRDKDRDRDKKKKSKRRHSEEENHGSSSSGKKRKEEIEFGEEDAFLFVRGGSPNGSGGVVVDLSGEFHSYGSPGEFNNMDYDDMDIDDFRGDRRGGRGGGRRSPGPKNRSSRDSPRNLIEPRGGRPIGPSASSSSVNSKKSDPPMEKKSDVVCAYFMQGKCQKSSNECNFSHNAVPPRKMELCKFWMMECCAKKEKCLYLHNDFPCKFFHTGLICKADDDCKFSHQPLSEVTKNVLLKHIETAPKEILGDFPRLNRVGALNLINKMEAKLNGTPFVPVSENYDDQEKGNSGRGYNNNMNDRSNDNHHHRHNQNQNQNHQMNQRNGPHSRDGGGNFHQKQDRHHGPPNHGPNHGPGPNDLHPPRRTRWEQPTSQDNEKLHELMDEAGISGFYKETLDMQQQQQNAPPIAFQPPINMLPNQTPNILPTQPNMVNNPALANVLASLNIPSSTIAPQQPLINQNFQGGTGFPPIINPEEFAQMMAQAQFGDFSQEFPVQLLAQFQQMQQHLASTVASAALPATNVDSKTAVGVKGETTENSSDKTKDKGVKSDPPEHLPAMQKELFKRFQQNQLKSEMKMKNLENEEPDEDKFDESGWYSSDEESDNKPTSLTQVLKNIKDGKPSTTTSASIISSNATTTTTSTTSIPLSAPAPLISTATPSGDFDLRKLINTSSINTSSSSSPFGDTDFRLPPLRGPGDFNKDIDLRTTNPFKSLPSGPAKEIQAAYDPTIEYKLRYVKRCKKIDYSHVRKLLTHTQTIQDPRLGPRGSQPQTQTAPLSPPMSAQVPLTGLAPVPTIPTNESFDPRLKRQQQQQLQQTNLPSDPRANRNLQQMDIPNPNTSGSNQNQMLLGNQQQMGGFGWGAQVQGGQGQGQGVVNPSDAFSPQALAAAQFMQMQQMQQMQQQQGQQPGFPGGPGGMNPFVGMGPPPAEFMLGQQGQQGQGMNPNQRMPFNQGPHQHQHPGNWDRFHSTPPI